LLDGPIKPAIEAKLKEGNLTTSSAQFPLLMAALKRDNGIEAMDYDLFAMSRDNLEDAISLRADDTRAQSALGRLLLLTGRGADEHKQALDHLNQAVALDKSRGAYPEPHLDRALLLMEQHTAATDAAAEEELKTYVALFQREHAGMTPSNMHILYDYMTLTGDPRWYLASSTSITTRNGEPMRVSNTGGDATPGAEDVVMKLSNVGAPSAVPVAASSTPTPAKTVRTSTTRKVQQ
jgi:hypothetical protein